MCWFVWFLVGEGCCFLHLLACLFSDMIYRLVGSVIKTGLIDRLLCFFFFLLFFFFFFFFCFFFFAFCRGGGGGVNGGVILVTSH